MMERPNKVTLLKSKDSQALPRNPMQMLTKNFYTLSVPVNPTYSLHPSSSCTSTGYQLGSADLVV